MGWLVDWMTWSLLFGRLIDWLIISPSCIGSFLILDFSPFGPVDFCCRSHPEGDYRVYSAVWQGARNGAFATAAVKVSHVREGFLMRKGIIFPAADWCLFVCLCFSVFDQGDVWSRILRHREGHDESPPGGDWTDHPYQRDHWQSASSDLSAVSREQKEDHSWCRSDVEGQWEELILTLHKWPLS